MLLAKLEPGWVTAPCKCLARPAARFWVGATSLPSALLLAQRRRPKGTGVLLCLPGRTGTRSMGSVITPAPVQVVLRRAARVEVVLTVPGLRRCPLLVLVLMLMLDADADADVVVAVGGWVLPPGMGMGMGF